MRVKYEDKAMVTCIDNEKTLEAEVLSFLPEKKLAVSVDRLVKLELQYKPQPKEYQGHVMGKTFISKGPKPIYTAKTSRG